MLGTAFSILDIHMTPLITKVGIPTYAARIEPHHKILAIGSCFSQNIGTKLEDARFTVFNNTFGTIFNPVSIASTIHRALVEPEIEIHEIQNNKDIHFHYDFHTKYNSTSPDKTMKSINTDLRRLKRAASSLDWVIITLGTAIAYRNTQTDEVVANCHKMPTRNFKKELLSIGRMKESVLMAMEELLHINPDVQIVLTVSPVRHTREGIVENNRSKARLLELCLQLDESIDYIHYFPAYEILLDELRDYRYYDRDLVHPSDVAIDYIWQSFSKHLISKDGQSMIKTTMAIHKDLNHRPLVPGTEAHKAFARNILKKIEQTKKQYPHVNYTKELRALKKLI